MEELEVWQQVQNVESAANQVRQLSFVAPPNFFTRLVTVLPKESRPTRCDMGNDQGFAVSAIAPLAGIQDLIFALKMAGAQELVVTQVELYVP